MGIATRIFASCILLASMKMVMADDAPTTQTVATANPIMAGADPHVAIFGETFWMYPTTSGTRFYAFASPDLSSWQRHGPVLSFDDVRWINDDGLDVHWAWAPCIVEKDGQFYFYYSVGPQHATPSRIGVAVGSAPGGPFVDVGRPLLIGGDGFEAIDPMVFTDPISAKPYLYAGGSAGAKLRIFEMKPDMISIAREIPVRTPQNFTEAPFVHYRDGIYYLTYSHGGWRSDSYSAHYATSRTPVGPWRYGGVLLASDQRHKGPGHVSILQLPGTDDWYIIYHRWNNREGPGPYQGVREIAIDLLEHAPDGRLKSVRMTDAGVGVIPIPAETVLP